MYIQAISFLVRFILINRLKVIPKILQILLNYLIVLPTHRISTNTVSSWKRLIEKKFTFIFIQVNCSQYPLGQSVRMDK